MRTLLVVLALMSSVSAGRVQVRVPSAGRPEKVAEAILQADPGTMARWKAGPAQALVRPGSLGQATQAFLCG